MAFGLSVLWRSIRLLIAALALPLAVVSCSREEDAPTDTGTTPQKPLPLLASYSLSITEPSGLAYSPATRMLWMISDNRAELFVIDTVGRVQASVPVAATDIEGIAVAPTGDTLYIVEESASRLSTVLLTGTILDTMAVMVRTDPKHALEGITITADRHRVVINEKAPTMLLEFAGKTEVRRLTLPYASDLSDICYDPGDDCYWIISDESRKVMKISRTGALLGEWSTTVEQGEGIALIGDRIYVVSDADAKLFVYTKPSL